MRGPSAKRQALLDAARRLGPGATVEELLAAAGAGVGTFYHHFPGGRDDLLRALDAETAASYEAGLLRVLQRNRDAESGVRSLVHHHARWSAENGAAAQSLRDRPSAEMLRAARAWARSVGLQRVQAEELMAVTLAPVRMGGGAERLSLAAWAAVRALESG